MDRTVRRRGQDPTGLLKHKTQIEIRANDRTGGPAMSKVLSVQQETGLSSTTNSFKNMESFTFFIGVDISKATLDCAVVVANKLLFQYQSSNDKKGIESFLKHLTQQCPEASVSPI